MTDNKDNVINGKFDHKGKFFCEECNEYHEIQYNNKQTAANDIAVDQLGKAVGKGIVGGATSLAIFALIGVYVWQGIDWVYHYAHPTPVVFNASDDAKNSVKSGFHVMTDYGTGQQYLVTPQGGIIQREMEK